MMSSCLVSVMLPESVMLPDIVMFVSVMLPESVMLPVIVMLVSVMLPESVMLPVIVMLVSVMLPESVMLPVIVMLVSVMLPESVMFPESVMLPVIVMLVSVMLPESVMLPVIVVLLESVMLTTGGCWVPSPWDGRNPGGKGKGFSAAGFPSPSSLRQSQMTLWKRLLQVTSSRQSTSLQTSDTCRYNSKCI